MPMFLFPDGTSIFLGNNARILWGRFVKEWLGEHETSFTHGLACPDTYLLQSNGPIYLLIRSDQLALFLLKYHSTMLPQLCVIARMIVLL